MEHRVLLADEGLLLCVLLHDHDPLLLELGLLLLELELLLLVLQLLGQELVLQELLLLLLQKLGLQCGRVGHASHGRRRGGRSALGCRW